MSLPAFREDGWLPEGHHPATWEEIIGVFAGEPGSRREEVLSLLLEWRDAVQATGLTGLLILDGSFISRKATPGDFDCIFVYEALPEIPPERNAQAKELLDYQRCRDKGYGDIFAFPAVTVRNYPAFCRLDVFDYDKTLKQPKGVVEVRI